MKKKALAILSVLFTSSALLLGSAAAESLKCQVTAIENGKVTLECGEAATKLEIGKDVRIKTLKARRAVEGC